MKVMRETIQQVVTVSGASGRLSNDIPTVNLGNLAIDKALYGVMTIVLVVAVVGRKE